MARRVDDGSSACRGQSTSDRPESLRLADRGEDRRSAASWRERPALSAACRDRGQCVHSSINRSDPAVLTNPNPVPRFESGMSVVRRRPYVPTNTAGATQALQRYAQRSRAAARAIRLERAANHVHARLRARRVPQRARHEWPHPGHARQPSQALRHRARVRHQGARREHGGVRAQAAIRLSHQRQHRDARSVRVSCAR